MYDPVVARLAARALPVSRPIDEDHKHFWEMGLRVALVAPPPLAFGVESTDSGSITATRRSAKARHPGGAMAHALGSLKYRLRYLLQLHWHRGLRRMR